MRLDCTQPGITRHREPEVSLHVAPGASLVIYRQGLACLSDETIAKGIRVSIDPKTPVEGALRILVVMARRGPPEIVLGKEDGSATGLAIGIPVPPVPEVPAETPVTIPLTLDLR